MEKRNYANIKKNYIINVKKITLEILYKKF